jgi:uncharacterized hydrophobic protein (TIGR00271 family)
MFHVRVTCPPDQTTPLTEKLARRAEVLNLVVMPAAARQPRGDAVQFDVLHRAANSVLAELRAMGLDRESSIIIETVDATLVDETRLREWRRFQRGEHGPVWELVEARIAEGAAYPPSFFVLLVIAGLIGACGILTDSAILIVGAMVVGPEFGAIISIALGLERRDGLPVRRGLLALLVGFVLAIGVTLTFAVCIRSLGHAPEQYLHGVRPVSDFINSPNLFSVIVAVLAAIAGVVSLTLAKTGALIGVFISVTTIPAAADIGVSLAFSSWPEARGSTIQLLLNVGVLITVGALGLRAQRLIWARWLRSAPASAGSAGGSRHLGLARRGGLVR